MYIEQIIIGLLALINLATFVVMAVDKRKSLKRGNSERIPEGLIFFMASAFGSGGVYLGMLAFRHKTKKWYFQLGIPLLVLQNVATLYLVREVILDGLT
jgi:uncharacterized membrane protein YsdA (DUF1294 family)